MVEQFNLTNKNTTSWEYSAEYYNKLAVYNQQVYNNVATTTERNSDWMHHLRYPIRGGNKYDH